MGTWGTGGFEDDNALDWVAELEESNGPEHVRRALETAAGTGPRGYLEASDGQVALAAAEIVAAASGRPAADLPDEVRGWVTDNGAAVDGLTDLARSAVARVMAAESELREVWNTSEGADADDIREWEAKVADLDRRLAGA